MRALAPEGRTPGANQPHSPRYWRTRLQTNYTGTSLRRRCRPYPFRNRCPLAAVTLSERSAPSPLPRPLRNSRTVHPSRSRSGRNTYTFEKGVTKTSGGDGFADVWMRGFFAWEYKGKHKDLNAAYQQCSNIARIWRTRLWLVVCDFDRFEVHTNYTNTQKQYRIRTGRSRHEPPTETCKFPPLKSCAPCSPIPEG